MILVNKNVQKAADLRKYFDTYSIGINANTYSEAEERRIAEIARKTDVYKRQDFGPAPLGGLHSDIPHLTDPDAGGADGFHQQSQPLLAPLSGGFQQAVILLSLIHIFQNNGADIVSGAFYPTLRAGTGVALLLDVYKRQARSSPVSARRQGDNWGRYCSTSPHPVTNPRTQHSLYSSENHLSPSE